MKFKVGELYQIFYGLNALSDMEMQVNIAYQVAKNKKMLIDELSIFDELKREYINEVGDILDKNKVEEINETEVELNFLTIDINSITNNVTPAIIEAILPILDIQEEN